MYPQLQFQRLEDRGISGNPTSKELLIMTTSTISPSLHTETSSASQAMRRYREVRFARDWRVSVLALAAAEIIYLTWEHVSGSALQAALVHGLSIVVALAALVLVARRLSKPVLVASEDYREAVFREGGMFDPSVLN